MIPIYICEDDPKQLEVLSTVIKIESWLKT